MKTIARISGDVYIPRGVSVPALDKDTLWEFQPKKIGNWRKINYCCIFLAITVFGCKFDFFVVWCAQILFYLLIFRWGRSSNWRRLICCKFISIEIYSIVVPYGKYLSFHFCIKIYLSLLHGYLLMQTVFENTLMQHHVALPPDAMGKVTYVASPGQYSLKVYYLTFIFCSPSHLL